MTTSATSATPATPDEMSEEAQQGQPEATPETGGNGTEQPSTSQEPVTLPDDHPLVKTLASMKASIASQKAEITELRAKSKQVTELESSLAERPTKEAVETLQTRYDRLEAFLQAAGGPMSKALDSRSFTKSLFETDTDVEALAKEWNAAHPTATATALSSSAAAPANSSPSMNDLLRSALKK